MTQQAIFANVFGQLDEYADRLHAAARAGAEAGADALHLEAKRRVPIKTGKLQASIYHAYAEKQSDENAQTYRISWNHRKAPHGHLIEFGTKRSAAQPFIRPAYEALKSRLPNIVFYAMQDRLNGATE